MAYLNVLPPLTNDKAKDTWRLAFSTWRRARSEHLDIESIERAGRLLRLLSQKHELPKPTTLLWEQGTFKAAGSHRIWSPQVNRSMTLFCRRTSGQGHHATQRRDACHR